jgi:hypothetical protein
MVAGRIGGCSTDSFPRQLVHSDIMYEFAERATPGRRPHRVLTSTAVKNLRRVWGVGLWATSPSTILSDNGEDGGATNHPE